jgi:hypothetical protein
MKRERRLSSFQIFQLFARPRLTARLGVVLAVSAASSLIWHPTSRAEAEATRAEACAFQPRVEGDFYFAKLPPEVTGWFNCGTDSKMNVFFVARLSERSDRAVGDFVRRIESVLIHDRVSLQGPHREAGGILRYDTERTYAQSTHYVRVEELSSGGAQVIFYSDLPENLRTSRGQVLRVLLALPKDH